MTEMGLLTHTRNWPSGKKTFTRDEPIRPEKPSSTEQNWFEKSNLPKKRTYLQEEWIAVRLRFAAMVLRDSIEIDPAIRGGVPVLKGTRIPVSQILAEVAEDSSISEIADDFDLDFNILVKLFEGMSIHLDRPFHR